MKKLIKTPKKIIEIIEKLIILILSCLKKITKKNNIRKKLKRAFLSPESTTAMKFITRKINAIIKFFLFF